MSSLVVQTLGVYQLQYLRAVSLASCSSALAGIDSAFIGSARRWYSRKPATLLFLSILQADLPSALQPGVESLLCYWPSIRERARAAVVALSAG